ncbi:MAG: hypothetical protein NC548_47475 [Lachnospiraceae bacterium]|nr:hypothetical protein [Lachnospiraceae bacterium]
MNDIKQNISEADKELEKAIIDNLGGVVLNTDTKAPIILPTPDELAVRVVPIATFEQLEEVNSDKDFVSNFFWTIVGVVFGLILNVLSSIFKDGTLNQSDVTMLATLGVVCVFLLVFYIRLGKRKKKIYEKIH